VQERILHIKLMNRPRVEDGQGENSVDRGWLDHRAEGLIVVDVESPSEAVKDPTRLVPFQRAVEVEHVIENPFDGDDVGANGVRNKIPGVVADQDNKLFFHGAALVRINEGGADEGGTDDKVDTEVADKVSLLTESRKLCFTHVVIG
jgi:hypothetical protein